MFFVRLSTFYIFRYFSKNSSATKKKLLKKVWKILKKVVDQENFEKY